MTDRAGPPHPAHWEADVVLRDGGTARIRPIAAEDAGRLVSFYEQVSDESKYYRSSPPTPADGRKGEADPVHEVVVREAAHVAVGEAGVGGEEPVVLRLVGDLLVETDQPPGAVRGW